MWERAFDHFMRGLMATDRLDITWPDGSTRSYGPDKGTRVGLHIHTPERLRALCLNPDLGLGEGFMDGTLTLVDCTLEDLLRTLVRNRAKGGFPAWLRAAQRARMHLRRFVQANAPAAARRNVAHHYDLSDDLYRLFLDADMQYSCAYFTDPDMSLEAAQIAKKAHIAGKLRIEPGMRVLDIGCGWGGMALTLAREHGAHVTGITLSDNQAATARQRAEDAGLSGQIDIRLQDYRHAQGRFDRIVSVGMLEHVGAPNYGTYFGKVAALLDPDGLALIHTIGASEPPKPHSAWINKYIFPGGYIPSLSELAPAIEDAGLWQQDIELWRLHYAHTIRHWRARFEAHVEDICAMYDDRFVAMFRYYLTACIIAFEEQPQAVYHFQLGHKPDAAPVTRDYLYP